MVIQSPLRTSPTSGTMGMSLSQGLKVDDFLPLLLAELQYQNPLEGLDTKDMLNQFASLMHVQQLSSLGSALSEVTQSQKTSQALAMVGKTVEAVVDSQKVTGEVKGVVLEKGGPILIVGNKPVSLSDVRSVRS